MDVVRAPLQAVLIEWLVQPGAHVRAGDVLAVVEAMKMEHEVRACAAGHVVQLCAAVGDMVAADAVLLQMQPLNEAATTPATATAATATTPAFTDADTVRPDLQAVRARHAQTQDSARPEAVAKRHAQGQRTARENLAALIDADSFLEYGALAVAAQSQRRSVQDLQANTPADGLVCGLARINGDVVDAQAAQCVVMAYDATVLAGTQGFRNHQKTDRLLNLALQHKRPVVLWAEGGGGRPGDVDMPIVAGLHVGTFAAYARLSGQVPVVGITSGRCFAGNAALLGCSDVIIATRNSNIGMGGPAMVEGGGLGVYPPEAIGPSSVQSANGVIDVLVDDDAQAIAVARQYLSFFQGSLQHWEAPPAQALRNVVPANRLRVYDTQQALQGLVDVGSLCMLRAGFGAGIHTALGRIEGRAVGLMANNPLHLSGAIDADAADKAARFMQLCNAHGLPLVSLVDTPGFMVGPDIETRAQVRHVSRMFVVGAQLRVPVFSVVLRKGYGLGAMAMTGGGFHASTFTVSWPTGEFGGMGLEGAVKLGYRKELQAVQGQAREALYQQLVAQQYARGSALNMAATLEIDAVIDPAHTRSWLAQGLAAAPVAAASGARFIDTW